MIIDGHSNKKSNNEIIIIIRLKIIVVDFVGSA